jgi:hypothetical protein
MMMFARHGAPVGFRQHWHTRIAVIDFTNSANAQKCGGVHMKISANIKQIR